MRPPWKATEDAVHGSGALGCLGALLLVLVLVGCSPPGHRNLRLGEWLIREGRPAEAIEPLREAVALLGTNALACAQAWNYLGLAYHYAARPADAAEAYQHALTRDFNLVVARFNRGCLFLEQGSLADAINELTTYTTHQPKDSLGWLQLGTAQLRLRLLDPAARSFQRVLELNPPPDQAAEALNNLGLCFAQRRRPQDAFKYLNAALKHQPNYPPALLNQAIVAQQQLKDRSLALDRYRAYLGAAGSSPNFEAVSNVAAQIEAELRPRLVATNQPPPVAVTTNLPPAIVVATTSQPRTTNALRAAKPLTPPIVTVTNLPAPPPVTNFVRVTVPLPAVPVPPPTTPEPKLAFSPPATNQVRPPPAVALQTTPPAPTPEPEPPTPPVEMVRLEPEPEVKTAQDLAAPVRTTPTPSPPRPVQPATTTSTQAPAPAVRTTSAPATASKPKKKSIIRRLNPLGWFGGKDDKEAETKAPTPTTPLPSPQESGRETDRAPSVAPPSLAVAPLPAPPPPPQPTFPRYSYLRPGTPVAGDRARAETAMAQGVQAHKEGRLSQAQAAYKQAAQADPSYFEAQYNLGVAAFDAGAWSDALAAFEHALVLKPDDPNARLNFALSLDRANFPVDAAQELERLLAATPGNVDAHATLANLYARKLGDNAKARLHYAKVLQLDPRHSQAPAIRRWLATQPGSP